MLKEKLNVSYDLHVKEAKDITADDVAILPYEKTAKPKDAFIKAKMQAGIGGEHLFYCIFYTIP